jgi:Na+/melibiose symporter-like transporter
VSQGAEPVCNHRCGWFRNRLLVIPVLEKWLSNYRIYQISLLLTILGYILMYIFGPVLKINLALDFSYILASIGIGSMFVAQTIFLADIVDYGEYKSGKRNESITFSMKGFLQKMAYTIQTVFSSADLA